MKIIPFLLFVIVFSTSCKKQSYLTFKNVLPLHQWRKTLEAVYNKNNEFEKYTFNFETAEDCEKNSFMYLGEDGCNIFDLCSTDYYISYTIKIENDSIHFIPYDFDTIHVKFSRFIEYYNQRSFVLRHDTTIENENKIIKETYMAF